MQEQTTVQDTEDKKSDKSVLQEKGEEDDSDGHRNHPHHRHHQHHHERDCYVDVGECEHVQNYQFECKSLGDFDKPMETLQW